MNGTFVMVDVEADGPIPGDYSMISFGAVVVEPGLKRTFYSTVHPISDKYDPRALAVSGFTREQCMEFPEASGAMHNFYVWLATLALGSPMQHPKKLLFVSDNNGFDWGFINWYLHHFTAGNPFGHSSTNLGSLYKGIVRDLHQNFKFLRKSKHTHNALDDALANASAMLEIADRYKIEL